MSEFPAQFLGGGMPSDTPHVVRTQVVEASYADHAVRLALLFGLVDVRIMPLDTSEQCEQAALACARSAGTVTAGENGLLKAPGGLPLESVLALFLTEFAAGRRALQVITPNTPVAGNSLMLFAEMTQLRTSAEAGDYFVPPSERAARYNDEN